MALPVKVLGVALLAASMGACASDDGDAAEATPAESTSSATALTRPDAHFPAETAGTDPVWVVSNYLDQRIYGKTVPDYFYVCGGNSVWAPAGIDDGTPPPFANEQDGVIDIRSYDPSTFEVAPARDQRYRLVTVDTAGYERTEQRTFILGPQEGGFCIGELVP